MGRIAYEITLKSPNSPLLKGERGD
jgi:hypothetical protein